MQVSGLSKFIGEQLTVLAPLPGWFITLLIALFVSVLTEITSNAAVVTVVTPIIIAMVSRLHSKQGCNKKFIAAMFSSLPFLSAPTLPILLLPSLSVPSFPTE